MRRLKDYPVQLLVCLSVCVLAALCVWRVTAERAAEPALTDRYGDRAALAAFPIELVAGDDGHERTLLIEGGGLSSCVRYLDGYQGGYGSPNQLADGRRYHLWTDTAPIGGKISEIYDFETGEYKQATWTDRAAQTVALSLSGKHGHTETRVAYVPTGFILNARGRQFGFERWGYHNGGTTEYSDWYATDSVNDEMQLFSYQVWTATMGNRLFFCADRAHWEDGETAASGEPFLYVYDADEAKPEGWEDEQGYGGAEVVASLPIGEQARVIGIETVGERLLAVVQENGSLMRLLLYAQDGTLLDEQELAPPAGEFRYTLYQNTDGAAIALCFQIDTMRPVENTPDGESNITDTTLAVLHCGETGLTPCVAANCVVPERPEQVLSPLFLAFRGGSLLLLSNDPGEAYSYRGRYEDDSFTRTWQAETTHLRVFEAEDDSTLRTVYDGVLDAGTSLDRRYQLLTDDTRAQARWISEVRLAGEAP